jgi:hypothetical protein
MRLAVIFPQRARSSTLTLRNLPRISDSTSIEDKLFIAIFPQKQNAQPLSHASCNSKNGELTTEN